MHIILKEKNIYVCVCVYIIKKKKKDRTKIRGSIVVVVSLHTEATTDPFFV